ncbi:MAG: DUF1080 domain-containing protein [Verrucomicrobia bacterium]|nr:DUF1080 domain-containing protein [Verrucomicrobiota bacterium]
MKTRLASLTLALLALSSSAFAAAPAGFKDLFNGKDLTGWKGLDFWSVKDGAIVGQTTPAHAVSANTFLVYQGGEPANFELRLSFRLTAQNEKSWGNSGVQYRSKVVDAAGFVIAGYQADIDSPFKYTGMLYEERGRGILMNTGEKIRIGATTMVPDAKKKDAMRKQTAVEKLPGATPTADIAAAYKLGGWNELVIRAEGNHLTHTVNGVVTADVTDTDASIAKSGVIALQLHKGDPMTIEFKNIYLKTLP